MAKDNIEISVKGVKFSYIRFIADSAPGYIIVLFFILNYYYPIFGCSYKQLIDIGLINNISNEVKLFIILLVFVLSTPLGLIINTFGWFIFGWIECRMELWCFGSKLFLVKYSKLINGFDNTLKPFFKLNKNNWLNLTILFEELLNSYHQELIGGSEYIKGARRLCSSIAFIIIFIFAIEILYANNKLLFALVSLLLFIIFMLLSSLTSFYYGMVIFRKSHILCFDKKDEPNIIGNIDNIIKIIIDKSSYLKP